MSNSDIGEPAGNGGRSGRTGGTAPASGPTAQHADRAGVTDATRRQVDGRALAADIGIDDRELTRRKSFYDLTEDDADRLSGMEPLVDRIAEDLVDDFYDRLHGDDEAAAVLDRSSLPLAALKRSQETYLRGLVSGTYDLDYAARRARVGKIHDMLGLGPELYLGAYTVYFDGLVGAIGDDAVARYGNEGDGDADEAGQAVDGSPGDDEVRAAVDEVVDRVTSLLKLVTFDQAIAMETYIDSYASRLERALDRHQTLANDVEREVETPIGELREATARVADRSGRIDDHAAALSGRAETMTEEASNLSATVEEIAATATQVEETSARAEDLAARGHDSATAAADAMADVNAAAAEVAADVEALEARIDHIDDVVEVIDSIADQTNILALNASIEAARAGDAGDGFAVVADEVKSLAGEAQAQARQIESTVGEIQSETAETVRSLDRAGERVETGLDGVEGTQSDLDEIADAVRETGEGIRSVVAATDEQAASTEAVASMADDVADTADEVSTGVADIAAATEQQASMVDEVQDAVERLTETEDERR